MSSDTLTSSETQNLSTESTSPRLQDYCRSTFQNFLDTCKIPFHTRELDQALFTAACDSASRFGCCMSGPLSVVPHLRMGAMMGSVPFGHRELDIQLFIALYTGYLLHMDDMCQRDASLVGNFIDTFTLHQPQGHPVLDAFAELLLDLPDKFGKVISNVMVTSALNMITALLLEVEVPDMSVSSYMFSVLFV